MIRVRLASLSTSEGDLEVKIIDGETLQEAVDRNLSTLKLEGASQDVFNAAVNGHVISGDLWSVTKLSESDNVLIAPKIKGARMGQVITIVALAVATVATGGAAAAGSISYFTAGLINAGVALVTSYVVSSLIPNRNLDPSFASPSIDQSQTYSISSQSNAVRKFQTVPKVYGRHRMFPIVAANPYTELEPDPNTGVYSQYLYAIYDFGMGQMEVDDIRIGNTPINNFDQVTYRLVDPNRPTTTIGGSTVNITEGSWDRFLNKDFTIYKGDVSSESVNTNINGNKDKNDPVDQYLAERNAPLNNDLLSQEITVNMVCPRGLYAFDSNANIQTRTIETLIEIAPVGSNNWKPFNDPATSSKASFVGGGGSQSVSDTQMLPYYPSPSLFPMAEPYLGGYQFFNQRPWNTYSYSNGNIFAFDRLVDVGILPNTNGPLIIEYRVNDRLGRYPEPKVGDSIKSNERVLGRIASVEQWVHPSPQVTTLYKKVFFEEPVFGGFAVATYKETKSGSNLSAPSTYTLNSSAPLAKENIVPGKFQIRAATQQQHFATVKFTPRVPGNYKVRVTRLSTSSSSTTQVMDELVWIDMISRVNRKAINTTKRHVFLEVRIKASGQLNGAIDNLSATCTSVLRKFDGVNWVLEPTRNPAWIYADILCGEVAKKPIDRSRLHTPSLVEWANYCDAIPTSTTPGLSYFMPRYTCDFVLDFDTTVQGLLQQVTSAAQATPNLIDGKYGVLLDINRGTPVQIFTPRNSWGFESSRNYSPKPHAVKVQFIDPASNWQPKEFTVYDTGYNELNATEIQELPTFGVTNLELATRYARYVMAQFRLRQETMSIQVDFENLVCTRGDYVQITQDVMKVGGTPARVKSISGNQIKIDDRIEIAPGSYGYTFRSNTGTIHTNTLTIVDSETFNLNGTPLPQVGNLIVIGQVGSIVFDCIVKAITPSNDFTATLTLVEKAEAVYGYENILSFQDYTPAISSIAGFESVAPPPVEGLEVLDNRIDVTDTGIRYYIDLDWSMPLNSSFEAFEIYVDSGTGFELQDVVKNSEYTYEVDPDNLNIEHFFKVIAVSSSGKKLTLGEVTAVSATPVPYSAPVPDVTGFSIDISNQTIHFTWNLINGRAITKYMIRYYPDTSGGTWETSTIVNTVSHPTNLYSTQARLGTYFIKAINSDGRVSENAAAQITTVPVLPNMNFIDLIDDFPGIVGSVERVVKGDAVLVLDQSVFGPLGNEQFYADGYYYFEDILDLGDIFTVRLSAQIVAEAIRYQDLMVNWENLNDVLILSGVGSSDWDVELQYQALSDFIPISEWVTLASIPIIGEGSGEFTDWRKFLAGDATGKQFKFRLKITSYNPSVTPRVTSAKVLVEMQTRTLQYSGLTANPTLAVNYGEAFYGPGSSPNVQITLLNGQSGDYWQFSSKTLTGFTIAFFDSLNNPVSRQFDASVVGYGRQATNIL